MNKRKKFWQNGEEMEMNWTTEYDIMKNRFKKNDFSLLYLGKILGGL